MQIMFLDNTMAKTTLNVNKLLDTVWNPGIEKAKGEVEAMQEIILEEGGNFKLEAWDWWHYSEKLRQEKFDFKEEEVKPYFSEDKVLKGAFEVAKNFLKLLSQNEMIYQNIERIFAHLL